MTWTIRIISLAQDVAWQVKWARDNLDGYLNFYSVSGDGRVTNWTIVKTALWFTDIMSITFSKHLENFSEDIVRDHLRGSIFIRKTFEINFNFYAFYQRAAAA